MKVITNPLVLGLMSALEFVAYRSADACIALAPGIAEGIQRKGGQKGDIHLIPNGCDLKLFNSSIGDRWRPKELEGKGFIAIFTGAHGVANGLDAVLDTGVELKQEQNGHNIGLYWPRKAQAGIDGTSQEGRIAKLHFFGSGSERKACASHE